MKKYFSLMVATAMLVSSTASFAGPSHEIQSLVRDYQIDVRVNNLEIEKALKNLSNGLITNDVTRSDLIAFVKANSSSSEFSQFVSMLETGEDRIANAIDVDSEEFSYILAEVFNSVEHDPGANYMGTGQGCSGGIAIGFGVAAVTVAIILAYKIYQHENNNGDIRTDNGNYHGEDMLRKKKIAAGVAGGLGALLIIGGATSC
jgi:hypothetical protein